MRPRSLAKWIGVFALLWLAPARPADAAKEIVVDYDAGLVYPLDNGRLVRGPVITNNGRVFKKKYLGTFPVSEKVVEKRSNMYNRHGNPIRNGEAGARMPYWMRLGRTAQGFHYSSLFSATGSRRRSRGCYRLSKSDAVWLFRWAPVGTPVHVVWSVRKSRFAWLAKIAPRKAALDHLPAAGVLAHAAPMAVERGRPVRAAGRDVGAEGVLPRRRMPIG